MIRCPRKLARLFRVLVASVALTASLLVSLLLVGFGNINNRSNFERNKSNSSNLKLEQLQRELLSEVNSYENFSELDKTTREKVVKHVIDISPDVTDVQNASEFSFQIDTTFPKKLKFLFVLSHYEQLGKTTENLFQLAAVAENMKRSVVQPFVRDSRMCGLQAGFFGEQRIKRRHFRPLSAYFNVKHMNSLLVNAGYSRLVELDYYRTHCSSGVEKNTLLHILYNDDDTRSLIFKWYNLSAVESSKLLKRTKRYGWSNCSFIDKGLNISQRVGNIDVGREICIDPEIVTQIDILENKVLQRDSCVIIVHWRGIGKNRTHFQLNVQTQPRNLVHNLRPSNVIEKELRKINHKLGLNEPYISVHIRAERQLEWYGVAKLMKCISVLLKYAIKLKRDRKISKVFLATDMNDFGSDTLLSLLNKEPTLGKRLSGIQGLVSKSLKAILYTPRRTKDWLFMDRGAVAIIEMNLLTRGSHLITLGSGTFQEWIMDVFVEKHSQDKNLFWSITRVCRKEEKNAIKRPA